jgi:hypothetical protein
MEVEFAERAQESETIPAKPPDISGLSNEQIQGGRISFRDKVLGIRNPPPAV